MFPFDIEDEELQVEVEDEKEPSEYEIDFNTGKLTGRIITGFDAIKQWLIIALSIDRYQYQQYGWEFGSDLHTLIGHVYSQEYIETEVRRMLEDVIAHNEYITEIDNIRSEVDKDELHISFTLRTIYGDGDVDVRR